VGVTCCGRMIVPGPEGGEIEHDHRRSGIVNLPCHGRVWARDVTEPSGLAMAVLPWRARRGAVRRHHLAPTYHNARYVADASPRTDALRSGQISKCHGARPLRGPFGFGP
jgi:hypothetical protein